MWQPIETAPKDGTTILLWVPIDWAYATTGFWFETSGKWETEVRFDRHGATELYSLPRQPTHWQPLPEPPA